MIPKMQKEAMIVSNKGWVLTSYCPSGSPSSENLQLRQTDLNVSRESLPDDHVALHALSISMDPYLRSRMNGYDDGLFSPQYPLNEVVTGFGIARVVESKNSGFLEGDVVLSALLPVSEYSIVPASQLIRKIDPNDGIPPHEYLGTLGVAGFSAWVGLVVVGQAKPEDNVFISAAAGAVGMIAGQIAKIKGCKVVGSAGTDEKVNVVKEEFGYDDAFNYKKESDFEVALSKYLPNGIDLYLDNVGGRVLEAVLNHLNHKARVSLCGMVSQYNQVWTEREGVRNLLNLVGREVRMEGYMLGTYLNLFDDFITEMIGYMKQGRLKTKHKIYQGIECFLESLTAIFDGANIGKVIISVSSYSSV